MRMFTALLLSLATICADSGSDISPVIPGNQKTSNITYNSVKEGQLPNSSDTDHQSAVSKPMIISLGNVTVLVGQRGELKCRVENLANYTVLWLRHRDTHLLSAGADAYTQDPRFRAFQGPANTWGLRISSTRKTDGGIYECQISTTPPVSAFTYLFVVEPVTRIQGLTGRDTELFVNAGSTINLTCIVEDPTDNAPKHILWKHDFKVVNFEWSRGGMSLVTEKKSKGVTVSRLLIQKAIRTDSGSYWCAPQNAHPALVKVIVLEQGENQAAIHSGSSCISGHSFYANLMKGIVGGILFFLWTLVPDGFRQIL